MEESLLLPESNYTYTTLPYTLVKSYRTEYDYEKTLSDVNTYIEQLYDSGIMSEIPIKYKENFTDESMLSGYNNKLYISDIDSAEHVDYLNGYNIKTVVYLGLEPKTQDLLSEYSKKSIQNHFFVINDRPDAKLFDILDDVYDKIHTSLIDGNVMVHCMAGISRSVSAVLYFLLKSKIFTKMSDAMAHIKSHRKYADPNEGFLLQVYTKARLLDLIDGKLWT